MIGAASLLLGSKLGRYALAALFLLAIAGTVARVLVAKGEARERARRDAETLSALKKRIETDEELARLPARERRERLRGWVRDQ